jgi:tripartite-type tricarboxylate transporter receptor subunit TctC
MRENHPGAPRALREQGRRSFGLLLAGCLKRESESDVAHDRASPISRLFIMIQPSTVMFCRSPGVFVSSMLKRASLALVLGSALATLALHAPLRAETFPTRSITIMPLLAAGTGLDVTVRLYAEQLSQAFGKPVVVENKPGGAGLAGVAALKAAPADGYTMIVATSAVMAIRPTLLKTVPYDPLKDFVPIALYVKSPFILVVNPALPIHSVPELIKYVKERPGQLSYSSSGVGGAPHLSAEYMKQRFDIDLAHVPYRNSPQSIADVAAGHVAMAFAEAGASLALIRDGKLRALAVTSSMRLPTVPELPPFGEAVGAPDFEAVSWHVLLASAGTPQDVVDKLHGEMKRIMEAPDMKKKVADIGLIPLDIASVEQSRAYIKAEGEKWGTLVRKLGLEASQ